MNISKDLNKLKNRKNRVQRKRYYRMNKQKITSLIESYRRWQDSLKLMIDLQEDNRYRYADEKKFEMLSLVIIDLEDLEKQMTVERAEKLEKLMKILVED